MRRAIRRALLVCAALAPMACATEGGLVHGPTGVVDEPAVAAVVPPAARTQEPERTASEIASQHSQAEEAYRARRFDESLALYERVVEVQPANAHAWLRLGNVHHQRRDWFKALAAYRRASARTLAGVETEPAVRAKAYYNVALINLLLARQSLRSLERLGQASEAVGDPAPLAREIERTQRRLEAIFSREPVVQPSAAPGARSDGTAQRTPPREGGIPPKVDYIRGEPRP